MNDDSCWFLSCGSFLLRVLKQKVKETMVETSQKNTKRGVKDKVKTNWQKARYRGGLTMEGKGNKL